MVVRGRARSARPASRGRAGLGAAVLAGAALATLAMAASAAAAIRPPFSHEGRWITDRSGRVVILHGVNMVNKLPPYHPASLGFSEDDVRFLAREGFNTVRLGIIHKGLEPSPGGYDDAYLGQVAETARMAARNGVYPLVDFHQDMYNERFNGEGEPDWSVHPDCRAIPAEPDVGFPGNYSVMPALWCAYDRFWLNQESEGTRLQDAYAAAWRHAASAFRGQRGVVGFDIFNEPWAGTQWPTCANPDGCRVFDQTQLTPFSTRVFAAIRQADRQRLLFYEPQITFNNGADTHHGDTGDSRA
jgi:endoglycosylceramidase